MPLYDYRCATCEQDIEVLQRVSEPPRRICGDDCALDFGPAMGRGEISRQRSLSADYRGHSRGRGREAARNAGNPDACHSCGHLDP